jgi:hypothetical protein
MRLGEIGDDVAVMPEQFVADGDTVVAVGSYGWKHKTSGEPAVVKMVHVWTLSGGKAIAFQQHVVCSALEVEVGDHRLGIGGTDDPLVIRVAVDQHPDRPWCVVVDGDEELPPTAMHHRNGRAAGDSHPYFETGADACHLESVVEHLDAADGR